MEKRIAKAPRLEKRAGFCFYSIQLGEIDLLDLCVC